MGGRKKNGSRASETTRPADYAAAAPSTALMSISPALMLFSESISPLASSVVKATSGLPNILWASDTKRRTPRPWIDLASVRAYSICFSDAAWPVRCPLPL